jgi:hypothetical protein
VLGTKLSIIDVVSSCEDLGAWLSGGARRGPWREEAPIPRWVCGGTVKEKSILSVGALAPAHRHNGAHGGM